MFRYTNNRPLYILYKSYLSRIELCFSIVRENQKLSNVTLCIFFTTFWKTTVEERTEVVHLMFFGSLKVFAYIIKMHLIILLSVDRTPFVGSFFYAM